MFRYIAKLKVDTTSEELRIYVLLHLSFRLYNHRNAFSIGGHTSWYVPQCLYSRLCETSWHKSYVPRGRLRCLHRGCRNQGRNSGCEFLPRTDTNLRRVCE